MTCPRSHSGLLTKLLLLVTLFWMINSGSCCTSFRTKLRADDIVEEAHHNLGRTKSITSSRTMMATTAASNINDDNLSDSQNGNDLQTDTDLPYYVNKKAEDSYSFRWDLFFISIGLIMVIIPIAIAVGSWIGRRIRHRFSTRGTPETLVFIREP